MHRYTNTLGVYVKFRVKSTIEEKYNSSAHSSWEEIVGCCLLLTLFYGHCAFRIVSSKFVSYLLKPLHLFQCSMFHTFAGCFLCLLFSSVQFSSLVRLNLKIFVSFAFNWRLTTHDMKRKEMEEKKTYTQRHSAIE